MYIRKEDKQIKKEIEKISKKELDNFIKEASVIAKKAGKYSLKFFGKPVKVSKKGSSRDIVTEVDVKCQEMIKKYLLTKFKNFGFYGEESGEQKNDKDFMWIVDPIDGTTNFAHGFPVYSVSIALAYKGVPIAGVIYLPVTDVLYKANIRSKAYKNGKAITVSKIAKLEDSLVILGFYYNFVDDVKKRVDEFTRVLIKSQGIRRVGSAAIDICCVAEGCSECFFETSLHAWDIAAGIVIATQAGATITEKDGSYYDMFSRKCFVVSNGKIHKEICKTLNG